MNSETLAILEKSIDRLIASHSETLGSLHRLKAIVSSGKSVKLETAERFYSEVANRSVPLMDYSTFSVRHEGRICFLGNTLPFRLFARLLRRPNAYVSHQILLDEIWEGIRSPEAVRSVVKTLRAKLRDGGLDNLANSIDGQIKGHYAVLIPDSPRFHTAITP